MDNGEYMGRRLYERRYMSLEVMIRLRMEI